MDSLSALFHAHAPAGAPPPSADLEAALRALLEAGREAWPAIELRPEPFVRCLADRAGAAPLAEVHAADLYLACACAERGPGASEAFDRAHLAQVGMYLSRFAPAAALVDDVRQALREKLFVGEAGARGRIGEYDGRAALSSWLRVIAVRAAIDMARASKDAPAPGGDLDLAELEDGATDPEIRFLRQRYRGAFADSIREAVDALPTEHREILRLHFVEGRTLDQLAASLGVHRATVARRVKAARESLVELAHLRLEERLGARRAELASLAGVMMSQLDLSLHRLLGPRGP